MRAVLATYTHAQLRVQQGDLRGARRILGDLLAVSPDHGPARALLQRLGRLRERSVVPAEEPAPAPRQPGDPVRLGARFRTALGRERCDARSRIRRLEIWLGRIARHVEARPRQGSPHD